MMNNNHKNSGCAFADSLVAYLYDEASRSERAEFEKHLSSCQACAEELEAFGGVHLAIGDWKMSEFAPLATPAIEVPYEKPTVQKSVESSWLAGLRQIFALSPAWSLGAASLAVLAIAAGMLWLTFNASRADDVAENNKNTKPAAVEKTPPAQKGADVKKQSDSIVDSVNAAKPAQPETAAETNPDNRRTVKTVNARRSAQKADNTPKNTKRDIKNKPAPKLAGDDDEEDDSLRLAELFAEIGTE